MLEDKNGEHLSGIATSQDFYVQHLT